MTRINLIGKVFGKLTVLSEEIRYTPYYAKHCLCRCECGKEKSIASTNLVRGTTSSCGEGKCKKRRQNLVDYTGQQFGRWLVLGEVEHEYRGRHWFCRCECGVEQPVQQSNLQSGQSSGCIKCHQKSRVGVPNVNARGPRPCVQREKNIRWKGGRQKAGSGYIRIYEVRPGDTERTRVLEHRWVMEMQLGRKLLKGENVHHINGVRDDNDPSNLELWVKAQPTGGRATDLVEYATTILNRYAPERLA